MSIDPVQLTEARPEWFEAWSGGAVRPFWLTLAINAVGVSRSVLAERAQVSETVLDEWEAGRTYPSWPGLGRLAAAVGVTVGELVTDAVPMRTPPTSDGIHPVRALMMLSYTADVVAAMTSVPQGVKPTPAIMDRLRVAADDATRKATIQMARVAGLDRLADELDATPDLAVGLLRGTYGARIDEFRQSLFGVGADSTERLRRLAIAELPEAEAMSEEIGAVSFAMVAAMMSGEGPLPRFGPVTSQTTEGVVLTFVGDWTDRALVLDDPIQQGAMLTISTSATNTNTGERVPFPDPARLWLQALLGDTWINHVVSAGARSGHSHNAPTGKLTTEYFYLFVDDQGRARQPPASWSIEYQPLGN